MGGNGLKNFEPLKCSSGGKGLMEQPACPEVRWKVDPIAESRFSSQISEKPCLHLEFLSDSQLFAKTNFDE